MVGTKIYKNIPYLELVNIDFTSAGKAMKKLHSTVCQQENNELAETSQLMKRTLF